MSGDEFQNLADVLDFLRTNPNDHFFPNEIANQIHLPENIVRSIIDNAILNLWVSVDHRMDDGTPAVQISADGNRKWNQLTGNAEALSTQGNVTNIHVNGENVNIGTDNTISSGNNSSSVNTSSINWPKWGAILTGIGVLVVIISIIVTLSIDSGTIGEQSFVNSGPGEFNIINSTIINEQNVFQKSEIVSEECESGEHAMTYVDCELGFQVTRPDTTWEFIENILGDAKNRGINMVPSDYYLGGVLIGSNTRAGVLIVVYDGNDPEREDLRKYVQNLEKSFAESYHMVAVSPSIVSADDDSAIFLAKVIDGDKIFHYEEKTEFHNDKFYTMIGYFWNDISPFEQYGKELQDIVKSIKYQE